MAVADSTFAVVAVGALVGMAVCGMGVVVGGTGLSVVAAAASDTGVAAGGLQPTTNSVTNTSPIISCNKLRLIFFLLRRDSQRPDSLFTCASQPKCILGRRSAHAVQRVPYGVRVLWAMPVLPPSDISPTTMPHLRPGPLLHAGRERNQAFSFRHSTPACADVNQRVWTFLAARFWRRVIQDCPRSRRRTWGVLCEHPESLIAALTSLALVLA